MIYLPYSTILFHSLQPLMGDWGKMGMKLYSCLVSVTSEIVQKLVCATVICLVPYISCHYVTGVFFFFFLHIQNHLDSMQVFSSYFSSKFCLSSPCDSLGVVPVTSFSCPVNYCTAHPWLICKHLINIFDLYHHRSNYWNFLVQTSVFIVILYIPDKSCLCVL